MICSRSEREKTESMTTRLLEEKVRRVIVEPVESKSESKDLYDFAQSTLTLSGFSLKWWDWR
jgi:hypothetical protein